MTEEIDRYARGATIKLAYVVDEGDPLVVTAASAYMRRINAGGRQTLQTNDPAAIAMTVTTRAATPELGAGWDIVYPYNLSKNLELGNYVVDLRLTSGSGVDITESVFFNLYEAASSGA